MIFSELYSAYYNTVAVILKEAIDHPLQDEELRRIIETHAFGESVLNIEPALREERWQLIRADGMTTIRNIPSMPLTMLQKQWLKAVSLDPRIKLFTDQAIAFPEVEPLFTSADYSVFDRYSDGDDYEDPDYQAHFRLILDAIRNHYPLSVNQENRRRERVHIILMPDHLEYSEKDDKFRLIGYGRRSQRVVNLGRIHSCKKYEGPFVAASPDNVNTAQETVVFELTDQRNALERVLLHFAHFQKEAERISEDRYKVTLWYEKADETEILIRILSFGPMVRVIAPQHFIDLIKERLLLQKSCER